MCSNHMTWLEGQSDQLTLGQSITKSFMSTSMCFAENLDLKQIH